MDVNTYLAKDYGPLGCWPLVADVYQNELGQGVNDYKTVNGSVRAVASAFRLELHKSAHGFGPVAEPVDFAVVLMGKSQSLGLHHCGIYYDGKVLHALDSGPLFQDLTSLHDIYPLMEFWAKS